MHKIITAIALSVLLCGCSAEDNSEWTVEPFEVIQCSDYANHQTTMGILNNNVWNKHAAQEKDWKQCLVKKSENGKAVFGWYWNWPINDGLFDKKVIFAYPQIKQGSSPWAPVPKFGKDYPLDINALRKLDIHHHLNTKTNGQHNTATSLWLTDSHYTGNTPNPEVISAEIMIWSYATKRHFSPAGKKVGEIEIGDNTWEVWHQNNWEDKSGQNDNKWTIVTFKAPKNLKLVKLDALTMLQYAQEKELIARGLFVADIELGNEIMSGSGVAWVQDFGVSIEQ